MRAHLEEETTRVAAIWRITRKDGAQFFVTDHDRDIVFGSEVYLANLASHVTLVHRRWSNRLLRADLGVAILANAVHEGLVPPNGKSGLEGLAIQVAEIFIMRVGGSPRVSG